MGLPFFKGLQGLVEWPLAVLGLGVIELVVQAADFGLPDVLPAVNAFSVVLCWCSHGLLLRNPKLSETL